MASAPRKTPRRERPPPRSSLAPAMSPGISVDGRRALMGLFDLLKDPLTDIGIGAVAIAREFLENGAQFAHAFRAFFADEAAFNQLHVGSMGHRHTKNTP